MLYHRYKRLKSNALPPELVLSGLLEFFFGGLVVVGLGVGGSVGSTNGSQYGYGSSHRSSRYNKRGKVFQTRI